MISTAVFIDKENEHDMDYYGSSLKNALAAWTAGMVIACLGTAIDYRRFQIL